KTDAPNAAMTLQLHSGHYWRGVGDLPRSANTSMRSTWPISLYLFGLLLGGCATDKRPPVTVSGFAEVSCPSDKSLVYLYRVRPWVGQGKDITMCVNYLPAVSLRGH